jgi:hypothetical protein
MSNKISWTWRHAIGKSELPFTTKGVLWALSHFMNDLGQGAYPTTKQLAEYCTLSERAICTHLQNAVDAGWLMKKEHGFRGQNWKNHEYKALWPDENGDQKGTELDSVAFDKGTERHAEGTEPNDKKALNEVQSKVPLQHSNKVSLKKYTKKDLYFEEFWEAFNDKRGKANALKVWKSKKLDDVAEDVISGAKKYVSQIRGEDPKYWKQAQGWLNGERWNDEPQIKSTNVIGLNANSTKTPSTGMMFLEMKKRAEEKGL